MNLGRIDIPWYTYIIIIQVRTVLLVARMTAADCLFFSPINCFAFVPAVNRNIISAKNMRVIVSLRVYISFLPKLPVLYCFWNAGVLFGTPHYLPHRPDRSDFWNVQQSSCSCVLPVGWSPHNLGSPREIFDTNLAKPWTVVFPILAGILVRTVARSNSEQLRTCNRPAGCIFDNCNCRDLIKKMAVRDFQLPDV